VASNHALATAFYGAKLGLAVTLLLAPEPAGARTRSMLLAMRGLGAELRLGSGDDQRDVARLEARSELANSYVIPTGGSSAVGNLGYVLGAFELAAQVRAGALPEPARIYLSGGTLGSAAGLSVGLALVGLRSELVVVRASSRSRANPLVLSQAIAKTRGLAGVDDVRNLDVKVRLEERFYGRGYAEPSAAGKAAAELARRHAGLELDGTYTAKALAALRADAPSIAERPVLFWHTFDARIPPTRSVTPAELPVALRGYAG